MPRAPRADRPPAVQSSPAATWWGPVSLAEGEVVHWQVGPLALWLLRTAQEWRVEWATDVEQADQDSWRRRSQAELPESARTSVGRHVFRATEPAAEVMPVVADRPVVVEPRVPIFVPPGEEATLYVSSPVWVRVAVGARRTRLLEVPTIRPTDTWFGNWRAGELCYFLFTRARLRREEVVRRPHRALTMVSIRNQAQSTLPIERLNLPVPLLSLYAAEGALWTESVTLVRRDEGELAGLEIRPGPPAEVAGARELAPPRRSPEPSGLVHAFSSLLGLDKVRG